MSRNFRFKRTRQFLKIGAVSLSVPIAILVLLSLFRVPISLDSFRPSLAAAAEKKLGRKVTIRGNVRLRIGFSPVLDIEEIRIFNPYGWPEGELVAMKSATARLRLLQLLDKKIDIKLLEADGVTISLAKNVQNEENWVFAKHSGATDAVKAAWELTALDQIAVRNLSITEMDESGSQTFSLKLDTIRGEAAMDDDVSLALSGKLQGQSISGTLTGAPLGALFAGKEAWPYQLSGRLENASLEAAGKLASKNRSAPAELQFDVDIPDLGNLAPAVGQDFDLGQCRLKGTALWSRTQFKIEKLAGQFGGTDVAGSLDFDIGDAPLRFDGDIRLGTVDWNLLRPKRTADSRSSEKPMNLFGKLRVSVDEVANLGTPLEDFEANVAFSGADFAADLSAGFANSPTTGRLEMRHLENREVDFMMQFESESADAGELINYFARKPEKFSGEASEVRYKMRGTGMDFPSIWKQRDETVSAQGLELAYATADGPLEFALSRYQIQTLPGKPSEWTAEGAFKGEAASLKINHLSKGRAGKGQSPFFELTAAGAGASIILRRTTSPAFDAQVKGDRLGKLAPWLGISREADLAYNASGELSFEKNGWRVRSLVGQVGSATFSGETGRILERETPLALIKLSFDSVKVAEMESIIPRPADTSAKSTLPLASTTILPSELNIAAADIDVQVQSLLLREGCLIEKLSFSSLLRDGEFQGAPISLSIGGTALQGDLSFKSDATKPEALLNLTAGKSDVTKLLQSFGAPENVVATADTLDLDVHARGSSMGDILDQSDVSIRFQNATYRRQFDDRLAVSLNSATGTFTTSPQELPTFKLDGQLEGKPFKLQIDTEDLLPLLEGKNQITVKGSATLPRTSLTSKMTITLPITESNVIGSFAFSAEKLSDLDSLFDVDLPPLEGCRLTSQFRMDDKGISLSGADAQVGETIFQGDVVFDTSRQRPFVAADFKSERFQIRDFAAEGWSPESVGSGEMLAPSSGKEDNGSESSLSAFLSSEVLRTYDAKASLTAVKVYSGEEFVGGGSLEGRLNAGKVTLDQIHLDLPGGEANLTASYHPAEIGIETRMTLKVVNFDYGIAARNKKAESKSSGKVNIDLDLHSNKHVQGEFLTNASGRVKFAVCPDSLEKEIFDLWATNLVLALVPRLDPDNKSKVNCMVGDLEMENGNLLVKSCFIDTTRVRAQVTGSVDLKSEQVELEVIPRAKRPQLLSLNTPVEVHGKFNDFGPRVTAEGAIRTVAGVGARAALFPLDFVTAKRPPEDGSDICPCKK